MYKKLDSAKRLLLLKLTFKRPWNKQISSMVVGVDLYYSDSIRAVQMPDTALSIAKHFTFFSVFAASVILLDKLFD